MVAANGIYRLAVIGTVGGQQHVHSLHFRSTVDPDALASSEEAYQQAVIDNWQSSARTTYRAIFGTAASPCEQYQVRKVCGATPLPAGVDEAEAGGSILGTGSPIGETMAPWLANNVTWRTALAGRRFRGRSFFGGMYEEWCSGATVATGRITPTTAYCTALVAAFVTPLDVDLPARLFVFSRTQSEVPGTQCQDAGADVRSFQVRTALASMKSRKAGSGI